MQIMITYCIVNEVCGQTTEAMETYIIVFYVSTPLEFLNLFNT